jgi:hypothetical protein
VKGTLHPTAVALRAPNSPLSVDAVTYFGSDQEKSASVASLFRIRRSKQHLRAARNASAWQPGYANAQSEKVASDFSPTQTCAACPTSKEMPRSAQPSMLSFPLSPSRGARRILASLRAGQKCLHVSRQRVRHPGTRPRRRGCQDGGSSTPCHSSSGRPTWRCPPRSAAFDAGSGMNANASGGLMRLDGKGIQSGCRNTA